LDQRVPVSIGAAEPDTDALGEAHTLPTVNVEAVSLQPSTQLLFGLANDPPRASAAPDRRGFPSISLGTTIA